MERLQTTWICAGNQRRDAT